jgi:hypothetical protein
MIFAPLPPDDRCESNDIGDGGENQQLTSLSKQNPTCGTCAHFGPCYARIRSLRCGLIGPRRCSGQPRRQATVRRNTIRPLVVYERPDSGHRRKAIHKEKKQIATMKKKLSVLNGTCVVGKVL